MPSMYLNPVTGDVFRSSNRRKKPPSQEYFLVGEETATLKYAAVFCARCREYHAVALPSHRDGYVELTHLMEYLWTARYGCLAAKAMSDLLHSVETPHLAELAGLLERAYESHGVKLCSIVEPATHVLKRMPAEKRRRLSEKILEALRRSNMEEFESAVAMYGLKGLAGV